MRKTIFFFFLILSISVPAQPEFVKDSLDSYVERALQRWEIPGAAVCIVKDGMVILARGYGVRELGKSEKTDENTLFLIGSNTKAFTGTALALLENDGKLTLEDKVRKWLPDFKMKDEWVTEEINLTDIVTHRMGMETFQGDFMYWTSDLTADEVIEKFGKLTPRYGFRTKYGYTNAGYGIAGKVIQAVTDTSWADFLHARIFTPLGMSRTLALSTDYSKAANISKPHTFIDNKMSILPFKDMDNLAPAGSIGSSVIDLSRWMIAQLDSGRIDGQNVIPYNVIQKTRTPYSIQGRRSHPFNQAHYSLYGLGWGLQDYEGREIVSHTGGVDGFVTSVTLLPEEKLGIAVLTNTDQNIFYQALKWEIIDAYLGLPFRDYDSFYFNLSSKQRERRIQDLNSLRDTAAMGLKMEINLEDFEGRYINDAYGYIDVKSENGKMVMVLEHHSGVKGVLEPLGGSRFLCTYTDPTYGIEVIPFKIIDGEAKSFTLRVDSFVEFTTYEFIKEN